MEITVKMNRLAIASFVSGLFALLFTFGLLFVRWLLITSPDETLVELPNSTMNTIEFWSSLVGSFGTIATLGAILMGILALLEIKKKGGMEKGKLFAWIGILLGAAWILFRIGIALFFILALVIPVR